MGRGEEGGGEWERRGREGENERRDHIFLVTPQYKTAHQREGVEENCAAAD